MKNLGVMLSNVALTVQFYIPSAPFGPNRAPIRHYTLPYWEEKVSSSGTSGKPL